MSKNDLLLKIPAMAVGAAGLGLSAYNVVVDGNEKARAEAKEELGEDYVDMYIKNLSSSKECHLLEKAKEFAFEQRFNDSFHPFLTKTKTHVFCWVGEVVENIIPITLSALALTGPVLYDKLKKMHEEGRIKEKLTENFEKIDDGIKKTCDYFKKGDFFKKIPERIVKLSKDFWALNPGTKIAGAAAAIFLLGAGKFLVHDVLGIGKEKL